MRAILLVLVLIGLTGAAPAVAQQPVGALSGIACSAPTPFHCIAFGGMGYRKFFKAERGQWPTDQTMGAAFCRSETSSDLLSARRRPWPGGPLNETVLVDVRCGSAVAVQRPAAPRAVRAAPRLAARPQVEFYEEPEPLADRLVERPVAAPERKKRTPRREYPASSTEAALDDARLPVRGLRDDGPPQRFRNRRATPLREPRETAERTEPSEPAREPVAAKPEDDPKPQPAKAAPPEQKPADSSISYEHF